MKVNAYYIYQALEKKHLQRSRPDKFFAEVCNGGNRRFDAVAIKPSWTSPRITGYEIKVDRQDFLNDHKWPAYLDACHLLYFVAPLGIIAPEELDPKVGLITYNPEKDSLRTAKKAVYQNTEIDWRLLYSIVINRVESDRYPFHSDNADFFKDWLENRRELREIGHAVATKMAQEVQRLERENKRLRGQAQHLRDEIARGKSNIAGPDTRDAVVKARQALEVLEGQLLNTEKGATQP